MRISTKSKISSKTFQKRIDTLSQLMNDAGNSAAKYVSCKISEDEYMKIRGEILLKAYNSLFRDKAYES